MGLEFTDAVIEGSRFAVATSDPQPADRLLHVCPDPALAGQVQGVAERAGLAYQRCPDAFAAALALLRRPPDGGILLLSLDGLARVEFDVARWARGRWPNLLIWAHGSADRLNGQTADAGLRLVELGRLAGLIGSLSDHEHVGNGHAWGPAPGPGLTEEQRIGRHLESSGSESPPLVRPAPAVPASARRPTVAAESWRPAEPASEFECTELPAAPAGPIQTPEPMASAPRTDAPAPQSPETPGLRVHRPTENELQRPIISAAEMEALLGPTEGDDAAC